MTMKHLVVAGISILALSACAAGERPGTRQPGPRSRELFSRRVPVPPAVRSWEDAGRQALRAGLRVAPSFRERVRFPAAEAHAVSYRFSLVRGQSVQVRIDALDGADPVRAEIFEHMGGGVFRPVRGGDRSGNAFAFAPAADGEFVLRIQPDEGRSGVYDVTVLGGRALVFPVADAGAEDVGGVFGDPRDGGAREHEGLDIFAPRGTPVLAVADGYIEMSRNTPIGGLVIWHTDYTSGLRYYYAHLDELLVREGAYVSAGDTIGLVGNTGNARGAPPHLHFGIYRPGTIALDPAPLLAASADAPGDHEVDGRALGLRTRVSGARVRLRASPSPAGVVIRELWPDTPLLVLGAMGEWQRVVLTDGTTGFVSSRLTRSAQAGGRVP